MKRKDRYRYLMGTLVMFAFSVAYAGELPHYDVDSYCNSVSEASGGSSMIKNGCMDMEQSAYNKLKTSWESTPSLIQGYCLHVAETTGGSYSILRSCIKMETKASSSHENLNTDAHRRHNHGIDTLPGMQDRSQQHRLQMPVMWVCYSETTPWVLWQALQVGVHPLQRGNGHLAVFLLVRRRRHDAQKHGWRGTGGSRHWRHTGTGMLFSFWALGDIISWSAGTVYQGQGLSTDSTHVCRR